MKPITKKQVNESIILNKGDVEQTTEKKRHSSQSQNFNYQQFGTTDLTFLMNTHPILKKNKPSNWSSNFPPSSTYTNQMVQSQPIPTNGCPEKNNGKPKTPRFELHQEKTPEAMDLEEVLCSIGGKSQVVSTRMSQDGS